ncbi:MAG: chromosomal replication initiator protein DnaA [Clostridia bacterium]|nr:chromosomal replication initiator protein DnaA [Clostridia bacterium]
MAIRSIEELWDAVCDECKKTITPTAFDCFLSDLKPVSLEAGKMILSINNEYRKSIIESNYSEVLKKSVMAVMGIEMSVELILEEDEEKIRNAEQNSEGLTFEDFFTFDNFIVGSTNRFAQAAAFAVADNPNIIYNPLIIYGNSGLGKTHLLLAIKNHIKKKYPNQKITYVQSEQFTNQLIHALQDGKLGIGTLDDFREKYRNTDVLLIDDIQFIAGKESTQEEFFNTFNALYQSNKKIIATMDRPPRDVKTLDDRIRSRFESGMIADITLPDFENRVGIINQKAEELEIKIEDNISYYIAEQIKSPRQLEGIVKKLHAYIVLQHKMPSIPVVQELIRDVINDSKPEPIKIETIISEVARTYNVTESDILSKRRTAALALARQVAMYITKMTTDLSYEAIGQEFKKDHSTVIYNVKKKKKFLQDKPYEKELVDDIIKNLQG